MRRLGGKEINPCGGYKLIYTSADSNGRVGAGIVIDKDLRENVLKVNRISDRLMVVKINV